MNRFSEIKPIIRVPLKYGLIGSIIGIILIVTLFYPHTHPLLIPPMFDFRIILFGLFIFFALKEFREYHNGNILNFWQGMLMGIMIYLIIGLVVALFIMLFSSIEPKFLEGYIEGAVKGLEMEKTRLITEGEIRITEEEFNRQVLLLRNTKSWVLGVDYLIKSSFIGFFVTIILSVILRRTEKRFTSNS